MPDFDKQRLKYIQDIQNNKAIIDACRQANNEMYAAQYCYNFDWLGLPIIQMPQDIVALQEIVYKTNPTYIVETGIARGGSLLLSASLLCLLDIMEGVDPRESDRTVIGVDIDIRQHNKVKIENHPLSFKIKMIEGDSLSASVVSDVKSCIKDKSKNTIVLLDSNHTHAHVASELDIYSDFVSVGGYCIVYDTCIEYLNEHPTFKRDWGFGNNPMTAVIDFLSRNKNFEIDQHFDNKLLISSNLKGYLKRIN